MPILQCPGKQWLWDSEEPKQKKESVFYNSRYGRKPKESKNIRSILLSTQLIIRHLYGVSQRFHHLAPFFFLLLRCLAAAACGICCLGPELALGVEAEAEACADCPGDGDKVPFGELIWPVDGDIDLLASLHHNSSITAHLITTIQVIN